MDSTYSIYRSSRPLGFWSTGGAREFCEGWLAALFMFHMSLDPQERLDELLMHQ